MKRILITTLFCSTSLSSGLAANIDVDSKVGEVTVYPNGAEITRLAVSEIPAGDHVIIIDDLPGQIVPNSVRVEGKSGASMAIGSVDVRQVYVSANQNSDQRLIVEQQIEQSRDKISVLTQQINNANSQRAMLQNLAGRAIIPRRKDGSAVVISATELGELFALTGGKLAELSAVSETARVDMRAVAKEINELQQKLKALAPSKQIKTVVAVHLSADQAAQSSFRIRYNIQQAGWLPVYYAKLSLGNKGAESTLKLVRRAEVRQSSTDDWENVSLTLSTARPSGNTTAPVLSSYVLRQVVPVAERKRRRRPAAKMAIRTMSDQARSRPVASPALGRIIARKKVAIEFAGFLAEYKIPGLVSVSNAGEKKNVTIGEETFAADISVHAVPKLDPTAYLNAEFTIKSKVPYLPGMVMLSRDGVFLGRGRIPLLNAGEKHSLGFGRDDLIKIKRAKVTSKSSESGFISTDNVEERKFITTINNLHDFPMRVIVIDNLPYATHEEIEVTMLSGLTRPSHQNVDNKQGVVSWDIKVAPGGEKIIKFGYKVSWPKKMLITPVR